MGDNKQDVQRVGTMIVGDIEKVTSGKHDNG